MFKKYRRKGLAEMRPYESGESLTGVSVAAVDKPQLTGGMIARNPDNHNDQWFVAMEYFVKNFEEVPD